MTLHAGMMMMMMTRSDLPGQRVDLARPHSPVLLGPSVAIVLVDDAGKLRVARSLHDGQG